MTDTLLQSRYLVILSTLSSDAEKFKALQTLLDDGFNAEINDIIPSQGCVPLHCLIRSLGDDSFQSFKLILDCTDTNLRDIRGKSVFDDLVPVTCERKGMFYELVERLDDPDRRAVVLTSAMSSGPLKHEVMVRTMSMFLFDRLNAKSVHEAH